MKQIFPTVSRRAFLQTTAGTGAGIVASGITVAGIGSAVEQMTPPLLPLGGPERWIATTCMACRAACGLRVRTIGGRAVYVKGNSEHPVTRGGLCPRALASLQLLYHPDRIREPLRKAGDGDSSRWEKISWEEALGEIVARWSPLQKPEGKRALVFLTGRREGLFAQLMRRFLGAFAYGRLVEVPSGLMAFQEAAQQLQGTHGEIAFDLESARYVLNFGCNLLEGWGSPVGTMRAFARWRDSSEGLRSKLVHIAPRLSVTGAKADEWVPLRPGTESVLALGIAYALIAENLYDREFVEQNVLGFEDWTDSSGKTFPGFRTQVQRSFRLGEVAAQTGVPSETILRLAREFGANRPALALGDPSSSFQPGTPVGSMAVHSLNILMGSAGTLVREGPSMETYRQTGTAPPRTEQKPDALQRSSPGELWEALQDGHPYRVESVFLCEANPSVQFPGGSQWTAALARIPFVVACTSFFDEAAESADLVLPAPHFLETWDEAPAGPGTPLLVESLVQPAVAPPDGVRHPGDVLLTLAKTLGGNLQDLFPDADFAALVAAQSKALLEQKRGYVFAGTLESAWYRLLQHTGWWAPTYASAEELWEQMQAQGGWWDPSPASVARAPGLSGSRKFQFLPPGMQDWPSQVRSVGSLRAGSGSSAQYPLVLEPFELLPLLGGTGAEAPSLSQSLGQYLGEGWQTWAEIHPETAVRFGLYDQQWAWLESPHGRIRLKVRIRAGLHPEVIAVPIGLGRTHGTEWIKGRGANPADLLTPASETSSPWPRWWGERVRILAA
jgi:anaerobic selenocysteine-containing dehydrogenase